MPLPSGWEEITLGLSAWSEVRRSEANGGILPYCAREEKTSPA